MNELDKVLIEEDREKALEMLVSLFLSCDKSLRDQIIASWDFNKVWKYPNPRRLTTKAKVQTALCTYLIDQGSLFHRESLIALCAIYHSAKLIGLNPDDLFEEFIKIATPKAAKVLGDFIKRSPDDKSLQAFGFRLKYNNSNDFELLPPWDN